MENCSTHWWTECTRWSQDIPSSPYNSASLHFIDSYIINLDFHLVQRSNKHNWLTETSCAIADSFVESTCVHTNYAGEFIFYTATCNFFILYITLYMFLSWSRNSYGRHSSNVIMYTSEFIEFNTREHRKTYMHSVSLFREYIHWFRADFHLWNEHFPDYRKILWRHRSEAYQPHALTWASLENVLDTHDLEGSYK